MLPPMPSHSSSLRTDAAFCFDKISRGATPSGSGPAGLETPAAIPSPHESPGRGRPVVHRWQLWLVAPTRILGRIHIPNGRVAWSRCCTRPDGCYAHASEGAADANAASGVGMLQSYSDPRERALLGRASTNQTNENASTRLSADNRRAWPWLSICMPTPAAQGAHERSSDAWVGHPAGCAVYVGSLQVTPVSVAHRLGHALFFVDGRGHRGLAVITARAKRCLVVGRLLRRHPAYTSEAPQPRQQPYSKQGGRHFKLGLLTEFEDDEIAGHAQSAAGERLAHGGVVLDAELHQTGELGRELTVRELFWRDAANQNRRAIVRLVRRQQRLIVGLDSTSLDLARP